MSEAMSQISYLKSQIFTNAVIRRKIRIRKTEA